MAAFDVISKDFQLRFRIDHRLVIEQDIVIGLKGVGFLGFLFDDDLSVEHPGSTFAEDAFVVLMAFAIRLRMMHQRVVIDVLFASDYGHPFQGGVDPLPFLIEVEVVAGNISTEGEGVYRTLAFSVLLQISVVYQGSLLVVILYLL